MDVDLDVDLEWTIEMDVSDYQVVRKVRQQYMHGEGFSDRLDCSAVIYCSIKQLTTLNTSFGSCSSSFQLSLALCCIHVLIFPDWNLRRTAAACLFTRCCCACVHLPQPTSYPYQQPDPRSAWAPLTRRLQQPPAKALRPGRDSHFQRNATGVTAGPRQPRQAMLRSTSAMLSWCHCCRRSHNSTRSHMGRWPLHMTWHHTTPQWQAARCARRQKTASKDMARWQKQYSP